MFPHAAHRAPRPSACPIRASLSFFQKDLSVSRPLLLLADWPSRQEQAKEWTAAVTGQRQAAALAPAEAARCKPASGAGLFRRPRLAPEGKDALIFTSKSTAPHSDQPLVQRPTNWPTTDVKAAFLGTAVSVAIEETEEKEDDGREKEEPSSAGAIQRAASHSSH